MNGSGSSPKDEEIAVLHDAGDRKGAFICVWQ